MWYRQGAVPYLRRADVDSGAYIPTPGRPLEHRGGYLVDQWRTIERVQEQGGPLAVLDMECVACGIKTVAKVFLEILDRSIRWLCPDCRMDGFDWASQIPSDELKHYQVVKTGRFDTLMRRLDRSLNPHDAIHLPVTNVESLPRKEPTRIRKVE